MTEERRKELGKVVRKYGEECKIAIRNVRREINDQFKQMEKSHEMSEDDSRKGQEQLQKITDRLVKEVDTVTQIKEKDLMEV